MLKSGDRVKIINNETGHSFKIGEIVDFIGVSLDKEVDIEVAFVFTNGKIEQGLYREDFNMLDA
jgi:hypothetical protein